MRSSKRISPRSKLLVKHRPNIFSLKKKRVRKKELDNGRVGELVGGEGRGEEGRGAGEEGKEKLKENLFGV